MSEGKVAGFFGGGGKIVILHRHIEKERKRERKGLLTQLRVHG